MSGLCLTSGGATADAVECNRYGSSVDLLESLPEQCNPLGNGFARSKCVNIIHRGKLTNPNTGNPTPTTTGAQNSLDLTVSSSLSPTPRSSDASADSDSGHALNGDMNHCTTVLNGCQSNGSNIASAGLHDTGPLRSVIDNPPAARPCFLNGELKQTSSGHFN
ncbi:unnamed protein product [Echinostoma caproni]|uniref:Uncharacterized protein n=1 Tax=Echinostoma caproni TaxID=27848 RepID=A0A183BG60_9TREM|nr:unnamed protein product [Echinostoma caproni]